MQYVICYDVADDRRRGRLASALMDFGTRVQESVFVAHLDSELAARMKERVAGLVDPNWDRFHVFEMCSACATRGWTLGTADVARDPEWYIAGRTKSRTIWLKAPVTALLSTGWCEWIGRPKRTTVPAARESRLISRGSMR